MPHGGSAASTRCTGLNAKRTQIVPVQVLAQLVGQGELPSLLWKSYPSCCCCCCLLRRLLGLWKTCNTKNVRLNAHLCTAWALPMLTCANNMQVVCYFTSLQADKHAKDDNVGCLSVSSNTASWCCTDTPKIWMASALEWTSMSRHVT